MRRHLHDWSPRNGLSSPDVRDEPVFIYGLAEPGGPVRYVGRSSDPHNRLSSHRSATGAPRVREWLAGLAGRGVNVDVVVLREVQPGTDAAPLERYFISLMSRIGSLLNRQGVDRLPRVRVATPKGLRRMSVTSTIAERSV